MRGLSRTSLAEVEERFNVVAGSADLGTLSDELFAAADLLDREHGLRRALSDQARPAEQKARTVRALLDGRVSEAAIATVEAAVSAKWSRAGDLADVLERLGVIAAAAEAEGQRKLDEVEDELFRFGRILAANPQLRSALADAGAPETDKRDLLRDLLAEKVAPTTLRLITQVAVHPRGRNLETGLEEFGRLVSQQSQRLVAVVRSAVELSEAQRQRLIAWLRSSYGRDVHLNVEVDKRVLGGFSVRIGDEIIDTTIVGRIEEVRRRLAG
ncbi:F0F1 ATP synthase subunit delta [Nonomuraea glycinis]|jgi:F-type H+-transporting ATPase subunit delta|uniref:ATP synthase subunit delta n=1 Tax=Nonomuraea glycinis TaxID=2047744 RepID=A0A918A328_9ACTN|nr:F0F1 ATP synthase subunit delta [Nonomuraea glycinis]MCA2175551.1 F0F1 ATP synthase subunit delta [Nonomuraea glycinis]GGP04904.1 ATP synthase subunit delta [Nonomuraea glycinis]